MPLLFPPPENNFQTPPPEEANLIEVIEVAQNPKTENSIQLAKIVPKQGPIVDEGHPNISETSVPSSSKNFEHIAHIAKGLIRLEIAEHRQKSRVNCLFVLAVILTLSQAAIVTLVLLIILNYI